LVKESTSFFRNQRGSIAVETALIASTLVYLLLNGVDLGRYLYLRAQVENATQAGAHAVWKTCDPTKIPIEIKCNPDAKTAVINVASSFVSNVEEDNVNLTDGYFCSDASGTLHAVSNPLSLPSACQMGITAGYYVQTRITYPYSPLFSNLTVAAMFASSISTTSHMRLQ
jgi:Flp pilus assembly protein TadG